MRRLGLAFCAGLVAAGLLMARPTQAKNVAAEILDILKANGQISEQQYRALLIKAQAEDEQATAAAEVGPGLTKKIEKIEKSVGKKTFLAAYWKSGLRLDSADGQFKLKIGGRVMNDWAVYRTRKKIRRQFGRIGDGSEFRRARFDMEGGVYDNINYKFQYDFASSDPYKDAYIQVKKVPLVGNFTVGHFKEPFSLEELTSSKYLTFMERSLPNTFALGRSLGVRLNRSFMEKRATAAVGFFRDGNPADTGTTFGNSGIYNATTRLTYLPWYQEKGRQLLHLGLSYRHAFHDTTNQIRFRQRPEAHLGPRFVETPKFHIEDIDYFNPEVALVYGPASLQFEWMSALVDRPAGDDIQYDGYYILGSFFLTGEHRPYKTSSGAFDRVKPRNNFDAKGGWGALELAARYSMLDLNDEDMNGGELSNFTFGLNWYLNPNVRFMLNYVRAVLDEDNCYYKGKKGDHCGDADIVQARFQVDF